MNQTAFSEAFREIFCANGLADSVSPETELLFFRLTERMLVENKKYNLTAVTDPRGIILKHYADCVLAAHFLPPDLCVADIGAGAGFPTLPLAIVRPDLRVMAVDSTEKRMRYVADTAAMLGLPGVSVCVGRAEELGRKPAFRNSFPGVLARAVARLNVLCELCLPLTAPGGLFCAMKSEEGETEIQEAERAISLLGGTVERFEEYVLTDPRDSTSSLKRTFILIRNNGASPEKYPRRYARIQSDPL